MVRSINSLNLISRNFFSDLNTCSKTKPAEALRSRRFLQIQILSSAFFHFGGLRSFGSLHYFKFDRVTLLQCPVAIPGDRRVVYEHIRPVIAAYESVSFRIVKPLNSSSHFVSPLDGDSGRRKQQNAAMSTNCAECIKSGISVKSLSQLSYAIVHISAHFNRFKSRHLPSLPQKSKVVEDPRNRLCVP